jgi:hypothetical protein
VCRACSHCQRIALHSKKAGRVICVICDNRSSQATGLQACTGRK